MCEFVCLCFSLRTALRILTKLLKVPVSVLRRLMIRDIIYLNDLLILGNSMNKIFLARDSVIFLLWSLQKRGIRCNEDVVLPKSR